MGVLERSAENIIFAMLDPNRVFTWLESAGAGGYYLNPLNLVWSENGVDSDLEHFRNLTVRLYEDPSYWGRLFRSSGWREQLIATTCALVIGEKKFHDDIHYAILQHTFVVPQLLVAFALLHEDAARVWISSVSDVDWESGRWKTIGAVEVISGYLEQPFRGPSEPIDQFDIEAYSTGRGAATKHWQFWQPRLQG
ncbi:hypothetical protein AAFN60_21305 [Roseibacillus persicicus]|uniref:hypothetical protein n=1 Tax=Roseibacillus persicicus TaxID=454148 RepID=UPI00398A5FA4